MYPTYSINLNSDKSKEEVYELNDKNIAEVRVQIPTGEIVSGSRYKMEAEAMKILTQIELKNLSFPDSVVESMDFDVQNKKLKIKTDSGFLSISGGIELSSCYLSVKNWQSIRATIYHAKKKKTENLDVNNINQLVDICEFEFGNELVFRGFGVNGGWIEINISGAIFEVKCL